MEIQRFIDEYEDGRRKVKEYPNFGIRTIFSPRRKRIKRNSFTFRENNENVNFHLKHRNHRKPKQVQTMVTRRQHLHFSTVPPEVGAVIHEAISYIQGSRTKLENGLSDNIMKNVLVRRQAGETVCVTMAAFKTVKDVKQEIEGRTGTPCTIQRLRHQGRPVKDCQVIGDLGQGQTDLYLLLFEGCLRGGAPPAGEENKSKEGEEEKKQKMEALQAFLAANNISLDDVASFANQSNATSPVESSTSGNGQDQHFQDELSDATVVTLPEVVKEDQPSVNEQTHSEFLGKCFPDILFSDGNNTSDETFCLRYMFGKKGRNENDLEKKFKFLILYDTKKTNLSNNERAVIWKDVIQKHTHDWMQLLPLDKRQDWQMSSDDNTVYINGEPMELRFGTPHKSSESIVKALPFDTFPKSDNSEVILLVDESVMLSKVKGHFSTSKDGRGTIQLQGKTDRPFHAAISFNKDEFKITWGDFMRNTKSDELQVCEETVNTCEPRRFKGKAKESPPYQEGSQIDCQESGDEGDLLTPCHEFKLFADAVKTDSFIEKFCAEVLKFACACLNSRKNGTLHFGIADENASNSKKFNKKPSEIVGVPVSEKVKYKDKLTEYINNYFEKKTRDFARMCICTPEFILVERKEESSPMLYVIEVDIETSYDLTRGEVFKVALDKKNKKMHQCFSRRGANSCVLLDEPLKDDMEKIDSKRRDEEIKNGTTFNDRTSQLREALKEDCGKLDKGFKRILVLSSVNKSTLTQNFVDKAAVLSNIPWSFIIDFNQETKGEFGLCKAMTEKTDLRIQHADEFNNARFRKDQIPEAWVFGNGMGESKLALSWEDWQTSEYLVGLRVLIEKAKEEFIPSRTIIFFLIRPGFSKIEAITYYNFICHFGKNAVRFYVEDEKTNAKWMRYMVDDLKVLDEHKYMVRGIVGLPWGEFCQEVENLTVDCQRGMIKIPYTENTLCSIERGHFNDRSVHIMDCEESDYLHDLLNRDEHSFERKKLEHENNFLSGRSEISMENLWFTENGATHIILRDVMTKLAKCFEYALSNDKKGPIRTIRFVYARGSGGTTVAKHFLWKLFHREAPFRVRCCVAGKGIMPETVDTIYKFWSYKNNSQLPIVVLLDDHTKPQFGSLVRGLSEKIECSGVYVKGPAVIFLRVESSSLSVEEVLQNSDDPNLDASMGYALNKKESTRFHEKYLDMQRRFGKPGFQQFAEMSLPSFMMRMQSSAEDRKSYAKRFVESALPDVSDDEKDMLTFLSLICSCVPDDPYIFTASFEPIMASYGIIEKKYQSNWTRHLGQNANVFLKFVDLPVSKDAFEGTDEGVAIVLREFAEEILEWACEHDHITIAAIALRFMNSSAFPYTTEIHRINEYVRCLYHKIYLALQRKLKSMRSIKRKVYPRFSEFINRILHIDNDGTPSKSDLDLALDVMELGFQKMARPVLAQQMARLAYICGPSIKGERMTYFNLAEKWIEIALKVRRDSYFLDTAGRIPLRKLQTQFPFNQKMLDKTENCVKALDLCMKSIEWFRESQRAEKICGVWNNAGYFGEMQAMYVILTLLAGSNIFLYKPDNVRKYVCIEKWQPRHVPWTPEHGELLKGFRKRYLYCLNKVEEISSILKTEDETDVLDYQAKFKDYFVYICGDDQQDDLARWRQNWMAIQKYIGGGVFKHVFNIDRLIHKSKETYTPVEALKCINDKLGENIHLDVSSKEKDIFLFIIVKMALYSPFRRSPLPRKKAVAEFLDAKKNMEILLRHEERTEGRHRRYCLLFSVMFGWPHDHPDMKVNPEWEQQYHATLRELEKMSSDIQKTYRKPDQDTGEEFCRRDKLDHVPSYSGVTTLFYLGKGNGLDMYVHVNELATYRFSNGINWDHPEVEKRLQRFWGERDTGSIIKITTSDKKILSIHVGVQWRDSMHSLERVSFYVGFSWKGPIAYAVTPC